MRLGRRPAHGLEGSAHGGTAEGSALELATVSRCLSPCSCARWVRPRRHCRRLCLGACGSFKVLGAQLKRICDRQCADALHEFVLMQVTTRIADVEQLEALVDLDAGGGEAQDDRTFKPHAECEPRSVHLTCMSVRRCTVYWLTSCRDQSRHLDVPALQRAVDRLVTLQASLRSQTRREGDGAAEGTGGLS